VDESALRYFAAQGDTRRVDAEIARLRALYPNWSPPTDLSQLGGAPAPAQPAAPVADPEIDKLWALFGEERYAEIRAGIATRQADDPQWTPPAELIAALDLADNRKRLVNASDAKQWRMVLTIATESPALLTCPNIDSLWRVGEAFAKTSQGARAKDVYTYILTNCTNVAERLATMQKALPLLPEQMIVDLLKLERTTGADMDDFSEIRDQLALRRVDRIANEAKQNASADDLAAVERLAQNEDATGASLVLGWYYYHHGDPEKARQWFATAYSRQPDPKAAEGLALSLRALNRFLEAENLSYEWRDRAPENLSAYKDIIVAVLTQDPPLRLDPRVISSAIPVITRDRFFNGAQALGWYSYNTEQFRTAREWFNEALEWKVDDEASAYGLALSLQRLNEAAAFDDLTSRWRARSQRIADLADGVPTRTVPGATSTMFGQNLVQGDSSPPRAGNGAMPPVAANAPVQQKYDARAYMGQETGTAGPTGTAPVAAQPSLSGAQPLQAGRSMPTYNTPTAPTASTGPHRQAQGFDPRSSYDSRGPAPAQPQARDVSLGEPRIADETRPAARAARSAGDRLVYDERVTRTVTPRRAPEPRQDPVPTARADDDPAQPATRTASRGSGANCNASASPYNLSGDAALTLGWCLMEKDRPLEAVVAFDQASRSSNERTRQDAAYGKSLAYLRKDLTAPGAVAAAQEPQNRQRQSDLSATILAQRALTAYREGRYVEAIMTLTERARIVPEQNDLMLIRGYSYLKLGRYNEAERIFLAVQQTGFSTDAAAGLAQVQEALRPNRQF
jgi:tetratricopeptide (TPR) repeat protein